ncbi:hypothetical protein NC652_004482 [Populus alba x Populus x berolinensis]|nr:hypothetical protein NC652_004482 [Populus alba x Populus x berolinensis]
MAEFSCRGFVDVATTLIQVQIETETGDTALMLAAKADQAGYFLELIVSGAELDLVNNNGETAVQLAKRSVFGSSLADIFRQAITTGRKLESEFGNTELLQMILQYSTEDIIKHDGLGLTPTMVSVKAGHTEAFRLLIDARADISEKSRDCQTVVSLLQNHAGSSLRNRFEEILLDTVLIHKVTCYSESRALHFAARVGNLPAIVQLLEMGFPINSVDDSGHSPLILSSREGHAYACKLLLQRGVACRIVNLRGETAISLAS